MEEPSSHRSPPRPQPRLYESNSNNNNHNYSSGNGERGGNHQRRRRSVPVTIRRTRTGSLSLAIQRHRDYSASGPRSNRLRTDAENAMVDENSPNCINNKDNNNNNNNNIDRYSAAYNTRGIEHRYGNPTVDAASPSQQQQQQQRQYSLLHPRSFRTAHTAGSVMDWQQRHQQQQRGRGAPPDNNAADSKYSEQQQQQPRARAMSGSGSTLLPYRRPSMEDGAPPFCGGGNSLMRVRVYTDDDAAMSNTGSRVCIVRRDADFADFQRIIASRCGIIEADASTPTSGGLSDDADALLLNKSVALSYMNHVGDPVQLVSADVFSRVMAQHAPHAEMKVYATRRLSRTAGDKSPPLPRTVTTSATTPLRSPKSDASSANNNNNKNTSQSVSHSNPMSTARERMLALIYRRTHQAIVNRSTPQRDSDSCASSQSGKQPAVMDSSSSNNNNNRDNNNEDNDVVNGLGSPAPEIQTLEAKISLQSNSITSNNYISNRLQGGGGGGRGSVGSSNAHSSAESTPRVGPSPMMDAGGSGHYSRVPPAPPISQGGRQRLPSRSGRLNQPLAVVSTSHPHSLPASGSPPSIAEIDPVSNKRGVDTTNNNNSNSTAAVRRRAGGTTTEQWRHTLEALERDRVPWRRLGVIGKGAYGTVYEGILSTDASNNEDHRRVAVKVLDVPQLTPAVLTVGATGDDDHDDCVGSNVRKLLREINLMRRHKHSNIVAYIHCQVSRLGSTDERLLQPSAALSMSAFSAKTPGAVTPRSQPLQVEIIMELCTHGTLSQAVRDSPLRRRLPAVRARRYIKHVLQGLVYLHARGVIHRDIKADNVLIDDEDVAKLADFGCSRRIADATTTATMTATVDSTPAYSRHTTASTHLSTHATTTAESALNRLDSQFSTTLRGVAHTMVGTPLFMAPEVIQQDMPCDDGTGSTHNHTDGNKSSSSGGTGGYAAPADIWAVGCLTLQLFGCTPWPVPRGASIFQVMMRIAQADKDKLPPGVPAHAPRALKEFFTLCLQSDPGKRATARELLRSSWMTAADEELEELQPPPPSAAAQNNNNNNNKSRRKKAEPGGI